MKSWLIPTLATLLFFAASALTCMGAPEGLNALQLKYKVARERLEQPLQTLREQYRARLTKLQADLSAAGDFTGALAARKAAAADGDPSPELVKSSPAAIAQVQKLYLEHKAEKVRAAQLAVIELSEPYVQSLEGLRTTLTKNGDLAGAEVVDKEIKKITSEMTKLREASAGRGEARADGKDLEIPPEADGYVRNGKPSANFGKRDIFLTNDAKGGNTRRAYVRFDLEPAKERVFGTAVLRLTCKSAGEKAERGELYAIADDDWEEGELTWKSRPDRGRLIVSWPAPTAGETIEIDVTRAVRAELRGDAKLSFSVCSKGSYAIDYFSRDNDAVEARPALVLKGK